MVFSSVDLSFVVLAGPICLVNLAFMIMLYNKGSLNSLKNGLLFSLACSDFCVGSITIPFIVFSTVEAENVSCKFPIASYLLTRLFSVSAAIHLLAIVYERFLKIMYPFWFIMHERRLLRSVRIVLAIWFASVIISTIPLCWLYSERCDVELEGPSENDHYTEIYDYACMAFNLVLLVLMVIAFARIYFVVRVHLGVIRANAVPPNGSQAGVMTPDLNVSANGEMEEGNDTLNAASQSTLPSSGVRSPERSITTSSRAQSDPRILGKLNRRSRRYWFIKEARVIVRFAAMVFMFAFVWMTYSVLSIMDKAGRPVANQQFREVVSVMQFLTSLFNPLIMTFNNQDFQSTWAHFSSCLCRLLGCCCPQSQPSLTNSRGEAVTEEREIPLICTNTVLN